MCVVKKKADFYFRDVCLNFIFKMAASNDKEEW